MLRLLWACIPLAFLAVLFSACDSGGDEPGPTDVAGEYIFTEFRFVPDSPLLPPAVILDTLVASDTRLQLFSSGRFTLLYHFQGASPEFIGGSFDVSRDRVRIQGREDEERFYRELLLSPEFTLRREGPDEFSATIRRTVDLEQFSDRYRGLRSVDGQVFLHLVRR